MTETLPSFPMARAGKCPFDPPPQLSEVEPISRVEIWNGDTPWLVTSYNDQRKILADNRFSANTLNPGYPHQTASIAARRTKFRSFIAMDDPQHAQHRKMLTSNFMIKRVEALRPQVQQMVDGLIDDLLAGPKPADLVTAFALPVPSLVICQLLGVPYEDHDFFEVHAKVANARAKTTEEQNESNRVLGSYVTGLLQAKMDKPEEDVLSDLGARIKAGEVDLPGASMLGMILLIAGHETSANMITLGTALMLENPDQLAILRDTDDKKVIANAVEELLRYLTIPHLLQRRIALEDIEIEGHTIRAGEGIISSLPSANFDPVAFPEPEKVDLTREARHHHAFGWGPHQCIGQQLARIELEVVFGTLFRRIPTLRLGTDFDKLQFKGDSLAYGIYELPVAW